MLIAEREEIITNCGTRKSASEKEKTDLLEYVVAEMLRTG